MNVSRTLYQVRHTPALFLFCFVYEKSLTPFRPGWLELTTYPRLVEHSCFTFLNAEMTNVSHHAQLENYFSLQVLNHPSAPGTRDPWESEVAAKPIWKPRKPLLTLGGPRSEDCWLIEGC